MFQFPSQKLELNSLLPYVLSDFQEKDIQMQGHYTRILNPTYHPTFYDDGHKNNRIIIIKYLHAMTAKRYIEFYI